MPRRFNISGTMISWNEAMTIDLALKGIFGLVKEIILVDTGSFDDTPKIAREVIDDLNMSGEVKQIKTTTMSAARSEAIQSCRYNWVLQMDANQVLSQRIRGEIKRHVKRKPVKQFMARSLNLMGDYEHYFAALPFHAPHNILIRKDQKSIHNTDRIYIRIPAIEARNWTVNLSRVRPAWRSWYRGEPFDRDFYRPVGTSRHAKGHMHALNWQYHWHSKEKYESIIDFIEDKIGLTLQDVKRIAPKWYLRSLQREAAPLKQNMRKKLPAVILQEIKNPRYKLMYKGGEIVGRWPEL